MLCCISIIAPRCRGLLSGAKVMLYLFGGARFFLNGHDVTDGVLWYVGQTLVYAGSIFGVGIYINSRIASISSKPKTDQPDDSPKDTPDR